MIATGERAVLFDCKGEVLVGIVHAPAAPADLGVIVVVGGPQYRAGSHRQFVLLARAISAAGFTVLRFDVRGMGDSAGAQRGFEGIAADIAAAIDTLQRQAPAVRRVVLWGLCDGASAALLYVESTRDARVAGVCAVNPWVRSATGLARTQVRHYYAKHVLTAAFWAKLVRGGVGLVALRELWSKLTLVARSARGDNILDVDRFSERMARGCKELVPGGLLVVLSENDHTAKEFADHIARSPRWQRALQVTAARRCEVAGADHTLSAPDARDDVEQATVRWLTDLCPAPRGSMSAVAEVA